eukprot:12842-Heterococcus_DN1.PRE.1
MSSVGQTPSSTTVCDIIAVRASHTCSSSQCDTAICVHADRIPRTQCAQYTVTCVYQYSVADYNKHHRLEGSMPPTAVTASRQAAPSDSSMAKSAGFL